MTFDEFKPIAKGLKAIYTSEKFMADASAVKIFFSMLADLPVQSVQIACNSYIKTNRYPPTPADIRQLAEEVKPTMLLESKCSSKYDKLNELRDALGLPRVYPTKVG